MDKKIIDVLRPTIVNKFNKLKPVVLTMDNDSMYNEYHKDMVEEIGLVEFLRKYTDSYEVEFINHNGDIMVKVAYISFLKQLNIAIDFKYFMLPYFGFNKIGDDENVKVKEGLADIFKEILHISKDQKVSLNWWVSS